MTMKLKKAGQYEVSEETAICLSSAAEGLTKLREKSDALYEQIGNFSKLGVDGGVPFREALQKISSLEVEGEFSSVPSLASQVIECMKADDDEGKISSPSESKYDFLPLSLVEKFVPIAERYGISEVARSSGGFLPAYRSADGKAGELSEDWLTKREGFIARHKKQMDSRDDGAWVDWNGKIDGISRRPSDQHIALIIWAYSPERSRIEEWIADAGADLEDALKLEEKVKKKPIKHKHTFFSRKIQERYKVEEDEAERFILGVVLEPNDGSDGKEIDPDSDNDIYSPEEIRKACHWWAEHGRHKGYMHNLPQFDGFLMSPDDERLVILENYITVVDIPAEVFGERGEDVKAGAWLQAYRVNDNELWEKVINGEIDAYSFGGMVTEEAVQ